MSPDPSTRLSGDRSPTNFFGMAGMETQVAVAIFIGTIYFLLSKQWWQLGIWLGLGLICRPDRRRYRRCWRCHAPL